MKDEDGFVREPASAEPVWYIKKPDVPGPQFAAREPVPLEPPALLVVERGGCEITLRDRGDWIDVEVADGESAMVTLDARQVDQLMAALAQWRKGAA